jgi:phospholipase C
MPLKDVVLWKRHATAKVSVLALVAQSMTPANAAAEDHSAKTTTPNQARYGHHRREPYLRSCIRLQTTEGRVVDNLRSKAIINEDGTPGPNYFLSSQWRAVDRDGDQFQLSPSGRSLYYSNLPPPLAGGQKCLCRYWQPE